MSIPVSLAHGFTARRLMLAPALVMFAALFAARAGLLPAMGLLR